MNLSEEPQNLKENIRNFFYLRTGYIHDIGNIRQDDLMSKINTSTQFSFSFIMLLVSSTLICTLGLLLNSPPVVIGGMIISPLMWPLMKTSLGITIEKASFIKQALALLIFSIIVSILSSFLITLISPLKLVTAEITARTTPTLLDLFVALAAGAIATLAIINKKISDSLAGVAIATSLMPPLCVSGVGLALFNFSIASGAFILFMANVISIVFVSLLIFILAGMKKETEKKIMPWGLLFLGISLIITALPLFILLKNYSFKAEAYQKSRQILEDELAEVSDRISVQNVKTNLVSREGENLLLIETDVIIPEDININYQEQNDIVKELEKALHRKIDLNLRVQKTIRIESETDRINGKMKKTLSDTFHRELANIDSALTVDSLSISRDDTANIWMVDAILRADPSVQFIETRRDELEQALSQDSGSEVQLNIDIISRIKLKSQPDIEMDQIRQDIQKLFTFLDPDIDLVSIAIKKDSESEEGISKVQPGKTVYISLDLRTPKDYEMMPQYIMLLKDSLRDKYKANFQIKINRIEKETIIF